MLKSIDKNKKTSKTLKNKKKMEILTYSSLLVYIFRKVLG